MTHMPCLRVRVAESVIIVHFYVSIKLCFSAQNDRHFLLLSLCEALNLNWIKQSSILSANPLTGRPTTEFCFKYTTSCKRYVKKIRSSNIYNGNLGET